MNNAVFNKQSAAQAIWSSIPGDYRQKCTALLDLFQELRDVRNEAKPFLSRTLSARTEEETVARMIGMSLTKVYRATVPIHGYPLQVSAVFAIADQSDHPLHGDCKAFIEKHNLVLKAIRSAGSTRPTYYVQRGQ